MASANNNFDAAEQPNQLVSDLHQLMYGPCRESKTLLSEEFAGETPMECPFEGVTKDTELTFVDFQLRFPDAAANVQDGFTKAYLLKHLTALGDAGLEYHNNRKEAEEEGQPSEDGQNLVLSKTVMHFNGKFYICGGEFQKARFTLNEAGETVEADVNTGEPTGYRYLALDDAFLPNLLAKLKKESNVTSLSAFYAYFKVHGGLLNASRVVHAYWNIANNKVSAVPTTPRNMEPQKDEYGNTPPPKNLNAFQQSLYWKEKAGQLKKENAALKEQLAARNEDHTELLSSHKNFSTAHKNFSTAAVINAKTGGTYAEAHQKLVDTHKATVESNIESNAELKELKAAKFSCHDGSHIVPQSAFKGPSLDDSFDADFSDDESEEKIAAKPSRQSNIINATPQTKSAREHQFPQSARKAVKESGDGSARQFPQSVRKGSKASTAAILESGDGLAHQIPQSVRKGSKASTAAVLESGGGSANPPPKSVRKGSKASTAAILESGGGSAQPFLQSARKGQESSAESKVKYHSFKVGDIVALKETAANYHHAREARVLEGVDPFKKMVPVELHCDNNTRRTTKLQHTSLDGSDDQA